MPLRTTYTAALRLCVCAAVFAPCTARATPCETASGVPAEPDTARALSRAHAAADAGHYATARAYYEMILVHAHDNREARIGMARADAWSHCYERAEQEYRALVEHDPHDAEASAGLVDVLLWTGRPGAASDELARGLAHSPNSPDLWQRRSVLALGDGDYTLARDAADHALALAPLDPELKALRDRTFMSELRASLRLDWSPAIYPQIFTAGSSLVQRVQRFELTADAQLIDRFAAGLKQPIVDGLYSIGAAYHLHRYATLGVGLGFGAPAQAVPQFITRAWLISEFAKDWTAAVSYSLWAYHDHKVAHIFAPSLDYALRDDLILEVRAWLTDLILQPPAANAVSAFVHAESARVIYIATPSLRFGISYTYGPQLDQTPLTYEFLRLTSHIIAAYGDWLITPEFGVQPLLSFEHRTAPNGTVGYVYSIEAASYIRW